MNTKYMALVAAVILSGMSIAYARVEISCHQGVICDNCSFSDVQATENGQTVTVDLNFSITSKNPGEINQMLISVNGRVVGFVSEGPVGNGKSGHGSVTFTVPRGNCKIELGMCFDTSSAMAKQQYERGHGYRIQIGATD
jgi:hypothetical protein